MKSKDCFFVDYPRLYIEEVQCGSLVLLKDPAYKPGENVVVHGAVKHLPIEDTKVSVVDKLYFHYLTADEDNIFEEDGKKLLRVPKDSVFCYVRDGQINMYGGYVFCKAVYDEDVEDIEVDGKTIKGKMSKSGLVTEIGLEYDKKSARIAYIDKESGLNPGDLVIMDSYCDQKYEIEGEEYFVMHEENILARITEEPY